ncbi:Conserved_hypothetical protein [Hexamita inflata]|uniref:Uncharacterized protein n=1 Tax=Hexamita inflata TaxID=28002 RepID=A0AA86PJN3_9EUKA|nr:Conserved hypothetical protein [Hexamita inflata]
MEPNQIIRSKKDLLSHFGSSLKLEIGNQQQMKDLLEINVPSEIWEDASNRNLLSFNQELIQETKEFKFNYFNFRKIEHIYLLSFLTNLTELNLDNNRITDISAVSKLKNLNKLNLSYNSIEDISALQSLLNLTHLQLQQNKLTSYTLALPSLVDLKISCNKLQDKSGLQHSPKLEKLNLSETETTDLRTIPPQLFGLKELYLQSNNLTEISYFSNFVDLQNLSLGCNKQLQNIGPLQFCTQLTELRIQKTSVADLWSLQFMKQLKTLDMNDTQVVDLHPLQNLYKLEKINAYEACIIDVSSLQKLTQLKDLYFSENKITNVDTLKHHNNFSECIVDLLILKLGNNNQLQNIGPLKFCTQLTQLSIDKTSIADIWPLQFLKNLNTLDISSTKVVDLHPLQHLYRLEHITANYACIIDVSPLSKLTQLIELSIWNNQISIIDTLKHHNNFSEYDFSDQEVPTPYELKFYTKILKVHSSHKQIRKIQAENKISKIRESMTRYRESIILNINEQIRALNTKIKIWAQFIQSSEADQ